MIQFTNNCIQYLNVALVADPETFKGLVKFRVAYNPGKASKYETQWVTVLVGEKSPFREDALKLKKGDKVSVRGQLQAEEYKGKLQLSIPFPESIVAHVDLRDRGIATSPAAGGADDAAARDAQERGPVEDPLAGI